MFTRIAGFWSIAKNDLQRITAVCSCIPLPHSHVFHSYPNLAWSDSRLCFHLQVAVVELSFDLAGPSGCTLNSALLGKDSLTEPAKNRNIYRFLIDFSQLTNWKCSCLVADVSGATFKYSETVLQPTTQYHSVADQTKGIYKVPTNRGPGESSHIKLRYFPHAVRLWPGLGGVLSERQRPPSKPRNSAAKHGTWKEVEILSAQRNGWRNFRLSHLATRSKSSPFLCLLLIYLEPNI